MREFRRISFTDAEVMHALETFVPNFAYKHIGAERKIIRSKRIEREFVFELAGIEESGDETDSFTVSTDVACSSLIEHNIHSKIPIPKSARKDLRLIHGHLCLDMFLDLVGDLPPVPSSREFRRIIFSNDELAEALRRTGSKHRRLFNSNRILHVGSRSADDALEFEIDLFNFKSSARTQLVMPHRDTVDALLEYTHHCGTVLPQKATKIAIESEGAINLEMRI